MFSCPWCIYECESFDESDEHYTEHITEYQMNQDEEFKRYSS